MRVVEVFADVGCPFTHVGLRRFVARRAELGRDDVVLRVRSWPLEVVNDRPLDPSLIGEEVDELREQVAPDLFVGFREDRFPTSSLAPLALTAAAYASDLRVGEATALGLRTALFEEGRDPSAPDVLADVAAEAGVPVDAAALGGRWREAVLAEHEEGVRRGVVGSPHFYVSESDFFCPALDIHRVDGHLRITADSEGFARFVERCLTEAA